MDGSRYESVHIGNFYLTTNLFTTDDDYLSHYSLSGVNDPRDVKFLLTKWCQNDVVNHLVKFILYIKIFYGKNNRLYSYKIDDKRRFVGT